MAQISLTYSGAVEQKRRGSRPRQWSITATIPPLGKAEAIIPVPRDEIWMATYEVVDCEAYSIKHRCWKDGELVVDLIHSATNFRIDYPKPCFIEKEFKGELENLTSVLQEFELTLFYEKIPRRYHEDKVGPIG